MHQEVDHGGMRTTNGDFLSPTLSSLCAAAQSAIEYPD